MNYQQKRFGAISGVFITNVLTIISVILFYREGWVVGNAGLLGSIVIIFLANSITLSTAFSLSSIVTNIKIKIGGSYFIVSRSLGPEIGGAIGITFFFAQTFSIALNIIGFTTSLKFILPDVDIIILNITVLIIILLIAIFNAELAIKLQYIILFLIIVSILSFLISNFRFNVRPQLIGYFKEANFWKTFAIFFPAATGILAGVSLSGDLKNPEKDIPVGTILSIIVTFLIYITIAFFFAFNFESTILLKDKNIMINSSKIKILIFIGIWSATLSSAIGCILGAPRTLQSLAIDKIAPSFFAVGSKKNNEPRRAMFVSFFFALGLLIIGNIDFIAQLLTMFFLTTYGIINCIVFLENIIDNPNFRPKFKTHWIISLYGTISCFSVMFLINKLATFIAILFIILIYYFLSQKEYQNNWGDLRKRFWSFLIEIGIKNYERFTPHPRNWRPNIAIFENNKKSRDTIFYISLLIAGKKGLISHYLFLDLKFNEGIQRTIEENKELKKYLKDKKYYNIFPDVIITNNDKNAPLITLQSDGIATYKPNTLITDIYLNDKTLDNYIENLYLYNELNKSLILVKDGYNNNSDNRIDVWISGYKANLSLMLILPYLIKKNKLWKKTKVLLRMIVQNESEKSKTEQYLKNISKLARIHTDINVIAINNNNNEDKNNLNYQEEKNKSFFKKFIYKFFQSRNIPQLEENKYIPKNSDKIIEIIRNSSKDARLVILGLNIPEKGEESRYAEKLKYLLSDLPLTLLVKSSKEINLFL